MGANELHKARTLIEGVGARNTALATRYMHPTEYTEHNPELSDGVAGVRTWISDLPQNESAMQTVRAFQDGAYVVTHTEGDLLGEKIFFDVFRFQDGLIVEHWAFFEDAAAPNESGHTQTDGPKEASPAANTERSKALIREYYETVHVRGDHDKIPQYVGDDQIRHEPGVRDGLAAFLQDLKTLTQNRTIDEIRLLVAQGDLVFVAAKGTHDNEPCAYIDLYRVEDGKVAEHWGFFQPIPSKTESRNGNGML